MIIQPTWTSFVVYLCVVQVHSKVFNTWDGKNDIFDNEFDTSTSNINFDQSYNSVNAESNNVIAYENDNLIDNVVDSFKTSLKDYWSTSSYLTGNVLSKRNVFGKRSSYIPDMYLNTIQLIVKYGYKGESHVVKTEDGYLLTIHRIPCYNTSSAQSCQPVFLQHGLLASSADFVITGPKNGLAFILANAGYDVWMGNFRGNTYSRAHVNRSIDDPAFWDFSWEDCAMYDLAPMIDYINDYRGSNNLLYVGHSMGTTTIFALLSGKPEYNEKLKAAFSLAPVAYMKSLKSPIKYLSPFVSSIEWIRKHLGMNEFLPENFIIRWLGKDCDANKIDEKLCENVLFVLCGYDEAQLNIKILPVILGHTPAGASTKTIIHFAQQIRDNGNFQKYDYGSTKNKEIYGQATPPRYNLSHITLPMALLCGENDWLSEISDAKRIYSQLGNPIEFYVIPYKQFNHLDFLWGKDAPTLVYTKLMDLMKKFT